MSLVENRYAEALIGIAAEKDSIDLFLEDLGTFTEIYRHEPGFKDFLLNPQNETRIKKAAVNNAFNGRLETDIIHFISLLLDKDRIKYLPGIYEEFAKLADEKRSVLNISIISATPLEEKQVKVITEKYGKHYRAASVKAQVQIDASLLGGVRVVVGGKMTDATVKGRLKELKRFLLK